MKRILATIMAMVFAMCAFTSIASATNYGISYKLIYDGPSEMSGKGRKADHDVYCYITTESGTVIDNNLKYRMRGRAVNNGAYDQATTLGKYQGAVSQKKLKYVEPYLTAVQGANYRKTYYVLAALLHSGTPDVQYTLNGKWNP